MVDKHSTVWYNILVDKASTKIRIVSAHFFIFAGNIISGTFFVKNAQSLCLYIVQCYICINFHKKPLNLL